MNKLCLYHTEQYPYYKFGRTKINLQQNVKSEHFPKPGTKILELEMKYLVYFPEQIVCVQY